MTTSATAQQRFCFQLVQAIGSLSGLIDLVIDFHKTAGKSIKKLAGFQPIYIWHAKSNLVTLVLAASGRA
jgi:hypothetical protein